MSAWAVAASLWWATRSRFKAVMDPGSPNKKPAGPPLKSASQQAPLPVKRLSARPESFRWRLLKGTMHNECQAVICWQCIEMEGKDGFLLGYFGEGASPTALYLQINYHYWCTIEPWNPVPMIATGRYRSWRAAPACQRRCRFRTAATLAPPAGSARARPGGSAACPAQSR